MDLQTMNMRGCKTVDLHLRCRGFFFLSNSHVPTNSALGHLVYQLSGSQLFSHTPAASIRIGWPVAAAATELPRCSRRIHQKSSALLLPARTTAAYYHPASFRIHVSYHGSLCCPLPPLPCTSRQASASKNRFVYHPRR